MSEPKPVVCPKCKGSGTIRTKSDFKFCETCLGKGTL